MIDLSSTHIGEKEAGPTDCSLKTLNNAGHSPDSSRLQNPTGAPNVSREQAAKLTTGQNSKKFQRG